MAVAVLDRPALKPVFDKVLEGYAGAFYARGDRKAAVIMMHVKGLIDAEMKSPELALLKAPAQGSA